MNKGTKKNIRIKKNKLNSKRKSLIQNAGSNNTKHNIKLYSFNYNSDNSSEQQLTNFLTKNSTKAVKSDSNETQIIFVTNFKDNGTGSHLYTRNSIQDKTIGIKILDDITSPFLLQKIEFKKYNENFILYGSINIPKIDGKNDVHIFNCYLNNKESTKKIIDYLKDKLARRFHTKKNYIIFFNHNHNVANKMNNFPKAKFINTNTNTNTIIDNFAYISENLFKFLEEEKIDDLRDLLNSK